MINLRDMNKNKLRVDDILVETQRTERWDLLVI